MSDDTSGTTSTAEHKTGWRRLRSMTDEEAHAAIIDDPDAKPTDEAFWEDGRVVMRRPTKTVTMRLDADLLEWFRGERGYQSQINAILRAYMSRQMTDHDKLVAELRRLRPAVRKSVDRAWFREPAVRIIDCVLSLHRHYDRVVVPRLNRFEQQKPWVRSVTDLRALIASYPSPHQFVVEALNYRHEARAVTLDAIVSWVIKEVSGDGPYKVQLCKLQRWATDARPEDYANLNVSGFKLAGFQYLRMLFGANTTKPDTHICRVVAEWVGHQVSSIRALQLLEKTATEADIYLRDLDTTLWEGSARGHTGPEQPVYKTTDTLTIRHNTEATDGPAAAVSAGRLYRGKIKKIRRNLARGVELY